MAALLGQVGRRQVDGDASRWQSEAGGDQGGADPFAGFRDGLVGKADDVEGRQPWSDLDLDIDGSRLDAFERHCSDALDHGLPLRMAMRVKVANRQGIAKNI
jgi:hypothetical protein